MDDRHRDLGRRLDDLERQLARRGRPRTEERRSYQGQVYDGGNLPTAIAPEGTYFLTRPVRIGGDEQDGNAGTVTADETRSRAVLVIGDRVPVAGDVLIAKLVQGGRWVAESRTVDAVRTVKVPCCSNQVPEELLLSSAKYGDATLTWDPTLFTYWINSTGGSLGQAIGGWTGTQTVSIPRGGFDTYFLWELQCGYSTVFRSGGWWLQLSYPTTPRVAIIAPPAEWAILPDKRFPMQITGPSFGTTCGPPLSLGFQVGDPDFGGAERFPVTITPPPPGP